MQVARQFFARLFLHFDHALFFFHKVLIQPCVLYRDYRLPADDIEQAAAFRREIILVGMGKEHHAVHVEPTAEGKAIRGSA